ncbi:hypothetical protein RB653_007036 [Dictyostelium firmibasis]|uniref:PH domain-containing protein n=1 Tax=Dictyostelium firmibasis TaxID=79012 RepID=A0AAN7YQV7_9MYCE
MSTASPLNKNDISKLSREGLKKRKNLDGAKESSSPLSKLRSATLRSGIVGGSSTPKSDKSKGGIQFDLGGKSTTNALSLHSSVPSNQSYISSPLSSPLNNKYFNNSNNNNNNSNNQLSFSSNSITNTPNGNSGSNSNKDKTKHNTLHRKSMRASMQLKIDEVMKIYAPLSGSEYLTKGCLNNNNSNNSDKENEPSSPSHANVLLNSPSSSPSLTTKSSSTSLSPVLNKLVLSSPNGNQSPSKTKSRKSIQNERMSQIRKQVIENAEFILGRLGEYQRSVLSLPDVLNPQSSGDIINSEFGYLVTNTKIITKILSPLDSISSSETDNKIITNNPLSPTPINRNINNIDNILSPSPSLSSLSSISSLSSSVHLNQQQQQPVISSTTNSTIVDGSPSSSPSSNTSSPLFSNAYSNLNQQQNLHGVIKNNQVFNSLTEMDIVAQSISIIAKKLLGIEIEIKKSSITEKRASILASFIRATRQFIETGIVPEIDIPSELVNSLFLVPSAENITQIYKPEEDDYLYKSGMLIKKGKKGPLVVWKEQWITLSPEKLSIHSNKSKKLKKEISLNSIVSITPVTKYEYKYCWMVKIVGGQKFIFRGTNEKDTALWMLAVDGLPRKNFDTNQSCINLYIKENLLETIGINGIAGGSTGGVNSRENKRRSMAGGVIRSSHGEEWTYRPDGTLFNTDFLDTSIKPKEIKYNWNGQFLMPASDTTRNLGHGKWNGVWLAWYNPNSNEPFLKYIWDQANNEYLNQNTKLSFKWSSQRGSLVSKIGNGEWLVEGRVPETIIMFLQCLRYIRHKELGFD